jgi:hypothetical protein
MLLFISCNREMRGAIVEGLHQKLMGTLECTKCRENSHMRQALIRGESHGLVMKGVKVRSCHIKGEGKVYGP